MNVKSVALHVEVNNYFLTRCVIRETVFEKLYSFFFQRIILRL